MKKLAQITTNIAQPFAFAGVRLRHRYAELRFNLIDRLARRWLLEDRSVIEALCCIDHADRHRRQQRIEGITAQQRVVFVTFRDLHLLDWFFPIDRALARLFPGRYVLFYIDFGASLKRVGPGFHYLPYKRQIQERFIDNGIDPAAHFSDQEIRYFKGFPAPALIMTTETIRQERFDARHRVYLPHYIVPKAKDRLPPKIRYQHVFLPAKPPFSYNGLEQAPASDVVLHPVGYPKMHAIGTTYTPDKTPVPGKTCTPAKIPLLGKAQTPDPGPSTIATKPISTVLYAPSLEIDITFGLLKQGLLAAFASMPSVAFIIKLHPTLSSKMAYLRHYIDRRIAHIPNIQCDSRSSIQSLGQMASILVTDFGSVGAEFRLSFGKRVLYLPVPDHLFGGADLRFRDAFADSIADIPNLAAEIQRLLSLGDLTVQERQEMKDRVLYSWRDADEQAARTLHQIIG
jgi:hypothetical protein